MRSPCVLLQVATALSVLAACSGGGDVGLTDQRFAPNCEVVWPAMDVDTIYGAPIELAVSISDADTDNEDLAFRAVSDLDGILPGEPIIDEIGATLTIPETLLSEGYHTLDITVSDEFDIGQCTTSFWVKPNTLPSVNFASPDASSTYLSSENILVEVTAYDADEADQSVLVFDWNGVAAGQPTASTNPESGGESSWFLPRLTAGDYTIGVKVTDPVGGNRTATVAFTVIPTDGDGDGWISAGDGGQDCDDDNFAINPAQIEICNGIDDNCDGEIDGEDSLGVPSWFLDADGDGFGDDDSALEQCTAPSGYIDVGGDCDDIDPAINPDADEVCNGEDENCNDLVDDSPIDGDTYYADLDGDTYGDLLNETTACAFGPGVSVDGTDCDDTDDEVSPIATEVCGNGVDDDCNGGVDEGCNIDHCGTISTATVWSNGWRHTVSCPVDVESTLIIEEGTEVEFLDDDSRLRVGQNAPGRLLVQGTAADPVDLWGDGYGRLSFGALDTGSVLEHFSLTGSIAGQPAIRIDSNLVEVVDGHITEGLGSAISVASGGEASVRGVTIDGMLGRGVEADGIIELVDTVITDNLGIPLRLQVSDLGRIANIDVTGNWLDLVEVDDATVREDLVWPNLGVPFHSDGFTVGDVLDDPQLTIEPGVEILFERNTGANIGTIEPGSLVVDAAGDPVYLGTSDSTPNANSWYGLRFGTYDLGSSIAGLEVQHANVALGLRNSTGTSAGTLAVDGLEVHDCVAAIDSDPGTSISLRNANVHDNLGNAVYLEGEIVAFENNAVTDNLGIALAITPPAISFLGLGNTYSGNTDERIHVLGGPFAITEDLVWPVQANPYVLSGTITVDSDAYPTLTLEDGLVLQNTVYAEVNIGRGTLVVEQGTEGVVLTSVNFDSPLPGDWKGLAFRSGSSVGPNGLNGLTIEYAGGFGSSAALWVGEDDIALDGVTVRDSLEEGIRVNGGIEGFALTHSTIERTGEYGLYLVLRAKATTISGNSISGSALPVRASHADILRSLAPDNDLTGNNEDVVWVSLDYPDGILAESTTVRDPGVPWRFTDELRVTNPGAPPKLTLEAGNVFEFGPDGFMTLSAYNNDADIEVFGTASDPVLFTSMQPTPSPGDWPGIVFEWQSSGPVDNLIVEYAGGGTADGAVTIHSDTELVFTDCEIRQSAGYGAVLDGTTIGVDVSGITFSGNASGDTNW